MALAFIDAAVHRLPNRLIAAGTVGTLAAFTAEAILGGAWMQLGIACLSALGLSLIYLLVAVAAPGIGLGDVKLAVLVGLATGWFGVTATVSAAIAAIMINGVAALAVAIKRRSLSDSIAHGPSMLAGALVAILAIGP